MHDCRKVTFSDDVLASVEFAYANNTTEVQIQLLHIAFY